MNQTNTYLAIIVYLLAIITADMVAEPTTMAFKNLGGGVALLIIYLFPVYLLARTVVARFNRE